MTCDNNCLAKNIQTSGQQLTFKLPGSTSATFEQINAIDGVIVFQGGSLIIKGKFARLFLSETGSGF
jgi:hypothetical protein